MRPSLSRLSLGPFVVSIVAACALHGVASAVLVPGTSAADTLIPGAAVATVTEIAVDPAGAFFLGGVLVRNAAGTIIGTELWSFPLTR